ncbi:MAG: response regulator transcription factor [Sphingobacterium sp.]|jgi:DNA-binding NarL/FixJ family response regulator|uniref:response regulator transcription factor n=1 Tax=Sphingobacterium sp. TaxID=341027 RepID=UPI00283F3F29|nr:response regulator transcription factor [Sphingobacterium sp.]MDR3006529.1 response regulator transcription factor [Sphingobacterium sp.]
MKQLLLVDDHTLVRSGFQLILEAQEDITVIAGAENGQRALDYLKGASRPDIILTDIHMEVMDGIQFIQVVKRDYPDIKIIVLSMEDNIQIIQEVLNLGAEGYLSKDSNVEEILFGIQQVIRGEHYVSAALSIELIKNLPKYAHLDVDRTEIMRRYDISERELSVLELIAEGHTNAEIADQIYLSKRTVEGHRQQLIEKTGSKNTAGLVRFGFQKKLLI